MSGSVVGLVLLSLAHAAPTPARADDPWRCAPPDRPGRQATSALDVAQVGPAQLERMVADLVPLVEEAAGARFVEPPTVGTTDGAGLADILEAEARAMLGNLYDAPPHMLDALAHQSRFAVPGVLGKYAPATGTVYLGTEPLARAIAEPRVGPERAVAAACLVLAHEITHALQDQRAGHGSAFGAVRDMDAFDGLRAVSEGHAVFVEERVAEALGWADVFWALNAGQGWGPSGLEQPQAFPVWALYGQGRAFVRHQFAVGGLDRVWTVLRAPPPRTSMIFRPETYAPTLPDAPSAEPAWHTLLDGVEQKLTRGDWAVVTGPVGELALRRELAGLDPVAVGEILGHLVRAHQRDLWMPDREGHVRVLEFDDPSAPDRYLALLSAGQEKLAAALGSPDQAWTVYVLPYDKIAGDRVVRRVVAPVGPHASALETQSVWVVRGERLVVVQAQRFRPGLRMDWTLEEVFARLAALDATGSP